ncbi:DUF3945 domain-containing protein [Xanthovirga aplysinae]|uniref:DUF3945 domain-containing protein n=1 Tax=Xanthovirga aplysinae TaxID=2529853 RepID=UPI0012BD2CAE|nr:DUF3945 domain-containing protein [Xanthovirga aplysinae]MTI33294.1 DUF3945 domain-containing protein [Xanthovirga aplysinae]
MDTIDIENIPSKIEGYKISEENKKRLAEGLETEVVEKEGKKAKVKAFEKDGQVTFNIIPITKAKERIRKEYGGIVLSEDQKKRLKAGESVLLQGMKTKKGLLDGMIRFDKEANTTIIKPLKKISIGKEIGGVLLTEKQRESLQDGKPTRIDGIKTSKGTYNGIISVSEENGVVFHAWDKQTKIEKAIQLLRELSLPSLRKNDKPKEEIQKEEPQEKTLEKISGDIVQYTPGEGVSIKAKQYVVPEELGGVKLTKEQIEDLKAGKKVKVNGVETLKGHFNVTISFTKDRGLVLHDHKKVNYAEYEKIKGMLETAKDITRKIDEGIKHLGAVEQNKLLTASKPKKTASKATGMSL